MRILCEDLSRVETSIRAGFLLASSFVEQYGLCYQSWGFDEQGRKLQPADLLLVKDVAKISPLGALMMAFSNKSVLAYHLARTSVEHYVSPLNIYEWGLLAKPDVEQILNLFSMAAGNDIRRSGS